MSHENHTYDFHLCYICVKSPSILFIFSKFWFSGLSGDKTVKNSPKWPKILSSHSISQEPYIIWLSFVETSLKWYLQAFFHFFKILIFQVVRGSKGKKTRSKMTKSYVHCALYLRNHTSYDLHLWYTCVKG